MRPTKHKPEDRLFAKLATKSEQSSDGAQGDVSPVVLGQYTLLAQLLQ